MTARHERLASGRSGSVAARATGRRNKIRRKSPYFVVLVLVTRIAIVAVRWNCAENGTDRTSGDPRDKHEDDV